MAATLATERVFEGFVGDRSRAFFYGHTYCGNPLGAAVAREVLRIYRDERILESAAAKGRAHRSCVRARSPSSRALRSARALGMIGAVDLAPAERAAGYLAPRRLARLRSGAPARALPEAPRQRGLRRAAAQHPRRGSR